MTDAEFAQWLDAEVVAGRMDPLQREELLGQKGQFDQERRRIERQHQGRVVGYAGGQEFVADGVHELLRQVRSVTPDRLVYFEPVGFALF